MLAEALRGLARHLPAPVARALERLAARDAVFLVRVFLAVVGVWGTLNRVGLYQSRV